MFTLPFANFSEQEMKDMIIHLSVPFSLHSELRAFASNNLSKLYNLSISFVQYESVLIHRRLGMAHCSNYFKDAHCRTSIVCWSRERVVLGLHVSIQYVRYFVGIGFLVR